MNSSKLSDYVDQRNSQAIQRETSSIDSPKDSDFKDYVLYVNDSTNRDPLSNMSIDILNKKPNLKKKTLMLHIQCLSTKPSFLDNTVPVLLDMQSKKAYKGEKCIEFLNSIKDHPSNNRDRKRTNPWK